MDVRGPNFIKQTLKDMKGQIHPDTMIVGDFNTQLSSVHRSSKLEISMVAHQVDLTESTDYSIQQMQTTHSPHGQQHFP